MDLPVLRRIFLLPLARFTVLFGCIFKTGVGVCILSSESCDSYLRMTPDLMMRENVKRAKAIAILLIIVVALVLFLAVSKQRVPSGSGTQNTTTSPPPLLTPTASSQSSVLPPNVVFYDQTIPQEYQSMYVSLKDTLDRIDENLTLTSQTNRHNITFAAELLTANANRGTALLAPQTIQGVIANLNALQSLGVQGVTVAVSYPLYTPSFPDYAQYVSFYKSVAEQVRSRGMKLNVKAGPIFSGTPFSSVNAGYAGLTFDTYVAAKKQMIQAIINDLHPDYLNLGTEPDVEYQLTNLTQLLTPDGYYSYVSNILNGLNKSQTKIGVGIGTWNSIAYVQKYVTDPQIDTITLHVYPVYGNNFNTMVQVGQLASQHGKKIVLDEAWCSKSVKPEGGSVAASSDIFRRDSFGFWVPIDQQFLKVIVKFSQVYSVDYVSPFWSWFFFGYINYSGQNANLSYSDTVNLSNIAALQNLQNDLMSPTGYYYSQLIRENTP